MSGLRAWFVMAATVLAFAALAIEPPQDPPGTPAKPEPAEQEPEQPEPEQPRPAPGTGDETAPAQEPAAEDDELPPLPPDVAPAGPSPQRFNPTEKVRADFPVSFPIDI
jgi:hypothetical protein